MPFDAAIANAIAIHTTGESFLALDANSRDAIIRLMSDYDRSVEKAWSDAELEHALRFEGETVVKAQGGEGSRGGHVIGHTRSGKPIYATGHDAYTGHGRGNVLNAGHVAHGVKVTSAIRKETASHIQQHYPNYTHDDHEDAAREHWKRYHEATGKQDWNTAMSHRVAQERHNAVTSNGRRAKQVPHPKDWHSAPGHPSTRVHHADHGKYIVSKNPSGSIRVGYTKKDTPRPEHLGDVSHWDDAHEVIGKHHASR